MQSKIFKTAVMACMACAVLYTAGFAQDAPKKPRHVIKKAAPKAKHLDENDFDLKMDDFGKNFNLDLNLGDIGKNIELKLNDLAPQITMNLDKTLNLKLTGIAPKIALNLDNISTNLNLGDITPDISLDMKDMGTNFNLNFSDNDDVIADRIEKGELSEKTKSYSKSYPLDANDKIKLSNQFGKINVITWDKHEVKVDVQIKVVANESDEAQKMLDGVQIVDSKTGDIVSFKTEIPHNKGSWMSFNFGGRAKVHKLSIDYTVYMPAKTDLTVEDSYGAIILPNLEGRVRVSSSYGSVNAQNLTNANSEIEGSYGNLRMGNFNGTKLDFSYGDVDMGECNNLKADLSYGSFRLGKLKGTADLDISYVSGFKIGELAPSAKRLNINSSYSGVALGIPGSNNFDFDITVSNASFNFNDDKVTITSKSPSDSRHYSSTKNYKGHFGKGSSEAKVTVNSSYGSVHFE